MLSPEPQKTKKNKISVVSSSKRCERFPQYTIQKPYFPCIQTKHVLLTSTPFLVFLSDYQNWEDVTRKWSLQQANDCPSWTSLWHGSPPSFDIHLSVTSPILDVSLVLCHLDGNNGGRPWLQKSKSIQANTCSRKISVEAQASNSCKRMQCTCSYSVIEFFLPQD